MSEQSQGQALQKTGPVSTPTSLIAQIPTTQISSIVPLDRENLTFFANMMWTAKLIPNDKNEPKDVVFSRCMAKMVAGTAYGYDPILSQKCFTVMFNQVVLNTYGQGIQFRRSGEYDLRILEHNDDICHVRVLRLFGGTWVPQSARFIGGEWKAIGEVKFTTEMAKAAKLTTGTNSAMWEKYRQDMLYARVMSRVVQRFNPSCLVPPIQLGNVFARESQPTFNQPTQAEPEQLTGGTTTPETPQVDDTYTAADGYTADPATESEAEGFVSAEATALIDDDQALEGEVIEYTDGTREVAPAAATKPASADPEHERLTMVDAVTDREKDVAKRLKTTVAELRNGRVPSQMDLPQLHGYYTELDRK